MEDYSEKTTTSNLEIHKRFDKLEEEIKSLRSTTGFLAIVVLFILFISGYGVIMLDDIKQDVREISKPVKSVKKFFQ